MLSESEFSSPKCLRPYCDGEGEIIQTQYEIVLRCKNCSNQFTIYEIPEEEEE